MFLRKDPNYSWTADYYDTIYKIYDKNNNLVAYFYPIYVKSYENNDLDEMIDRLNHSKALIKGARILLPMIKLNLLDIEEGIQLHDVISRLERNATQSRNWQEWLLSKSSQYKISNYLVFTAREDREMLSILLNLDVQFHADKKDIIRLVAPMLDELSIKGLI